MPGTVSIIGLGKIGSSFAKAFKTQGPAYYVIGSDLEPSAEKHADENR